MKGFPKVFSTKQDFYNVFSMYPEKAKARLQELYDNRFVWKKVGEVTSAEGLEDATNKVISTSEDTAEGEKRELLLHMRLVEDANAEFFRLGWTVDEAVIFLTRNSVEA